MKLDVRTQQEYTKLYVAEDEINFIQAETLKSRVKELISQGHKNLLLNLSKVNYIDSTALSVMVSIHKTCLANHGQLRVCCPSNDVEMIFYLTGVDNFLNIDKSEIQSVEAFSSTPEAKQA